MRHRTVAFGFAALFLWVNRPAPAQQTPALPGSQQLTAISVQEQPAPGTELSLDQLVQEALARNPEIRSALSQVNSLRHRVPQAKTLPDPTVSVGWMGNITPFSVQHNDPSSYRGVNAMEVFPYPGKLKLRGEIANRETEAARWQYEAVRRRVVAQVKTAYYQYYFANQAAALTRKNKDLMEKLAKIAEARYRVGKGIQQDVLKSQVEISRLVQQLTVLDQQEKTAQVRLDTLLDSDPDTPLPPPAPVRQADFKYTLPQLYQLAQSNDTGLQGDQRLVKRDQERIALAKKDYLPDFTVGYAYEQRPDMADMHGFTAGINVPVFYRSKQREEVKEAADALVSERQGQENRRTNLFFEVKEQYLSAQASSELLHLYSGAIVPQSSLALESSMAAYEVGKVDFLTILDNFITVLDYQTGYYRELVDYQIALARLEPLVGVDLTK